jgi:hypothetical protein
MQVDSLTQFSHLENMEEQQALQAQRSDLVAQAQDYYEAQQHGFQRAVREFKQEARDVTQTELAQQTAKITGQFRGALTDASRQIHIEQTAAQEARSRALETERRAHEALWSQKTDVENKAETAIENQRNVVTAEATEIIRMQRQELFDFENQAAATAGSTVHCLSEQINMLRYEFAESQLFNQSLQAQHDNDRREFMSLAEAWTGEVREECRQRDQLEVSCQRYYRTAEEFHSELTVASRQTTSAPDAFLISSLRHQLDECKEQIFELNGCGDRANSVVARQKQLFD